MKGALERAFMGAGRVRGSPLKPLFDRLEERLKNRKRSVRLGVYFTQEEYAALREKSKSARLTMGEFIRRSIAGKEVKQAPSADIPVLIRDIRRAGNNVNQLLKIANSTHLLDAPQMRKVLAKTYLAADAVVRAYTTED